MQIFNVGYSKAIAEFKARFNVKLDWMVCNQGSPAVVEQLAFLTRLKKQDISFSGEKYGHVGCSDLIIGLDELEKRETLRGYGIALSCNVSTWGAGLIQNPS